MFVVKVKAKIIEDNTGAKVELPILRTEKGPLMSVVRYVLNLHVSGASLSTITSNLRSIILLLRFMDANRTIFSDPQTLLETFVRRLYSGTFNEEGLDPSELCWVPASIPTTNIHIGNLTRFTDWLYDRGYCREIANSLREASPHEERLNYAAWFRKNQSDYLGHIKDKRASAAIKKVRSIKGKRRKMWEDDDVACFPNDQFKNFFSHGIGNTKNMLVGLRDKLILLLLHGAGLRSSEALLIWTTDVFVHSKDASRAVVRVYNEEEGIAPFGAKTRDGAAQIRAAYLKEKYGRIPRARMIGTEKLGWKGNTVYGPNGYIEAYFFPTYFDKTFMSLWRTYMQYRIQIETNHPYAFISFSPNNIGRPLTYNAFYDSYGKGLKRIGLSPSKADGFDPHGHRHNYGARLAEAELPPSVIKKCMHHASITSQEVYTKPSRARVSEAFSKAEKQLAQSIQTEEQLRQSLQAVKTQDVLDWETLTKYGFEDIDPYGYFTGQDPKFGKHRKG